MTDAQRTILVVEDEPVLRGLLADVMHLNGLLTLEAADGEEGLATALRDHPDLVVLDILMPKLDGMQVLKKLREDGWGRTVPVIILTNIDPDAQQLKEVEEYRASYCLIKAQTSMEQLAVKVQELLNG